MCANQPWPFRAEVDGCEGCTYNCGTGTFTCTSCRCHCPHNSYGSYDQPYGDGHQPYGQQGSYGGDHDGGSYEHDGHEGTHGDKQYHEDSHEGEHYYKEGQEEEHSYGDSKQSYGEGEHSGGSYGEEKHSYGGDTHPYEEQEEEGADATPLEQEEEQQERMLPLTQPIARTQKPAAPAKPVAFRSLGDMMRGSTSSDSANQDADAETDRAPRESDRLELAEEEFGGEEGQEMDQEQEREVLLEQEEQERPMALAKPVRPKSLGDLMLGGPTRAHIASVADKKSTSVSTAATWHPLTGAVSTRSKSAVESTAAAWHPLTGASSRGGYEQPDCSGDHPQCTCGPLPLTITAQCTLVVYDACSNTLKCSSGDYYPSTGY